MMRMIKIIDKAVCATVNENLKVNEVREERLRWWKGHDWLKREKPTKKDK